MIYALTDKILYQMLMVKIKPLVLREDVNLKGMIPFFTVHGEATVSRLYTGKVRRA